MFSKEGSTSLYQMQEAGLLDELESRLGEDREVRDPEPIGLSVEHLLQRFAQQANHVAV